MTLRTILENVSFTSPQEIEETFEKIAKSLLYDGFVKIRNEYRVYIKTVEFYLHAEKGSPLEVSDPIVYHRNGKYPDRIEVPYFPLMTFHAHTSGFDITFENEALKYRASALIRAYEIYDEKLGRFIETKKGSRYDDRSTFLYYYLNGFSSESNNDITWVDCKSWVKHELKAPAPRRNVHEYDGEMETDKKDMRLWSYSRQNDIEVEVMNKHKEIVSWANKYVPRFNKLSEQFRTHYYTQSPLNVINDTIELMIIGINPKGDLNSGERKLTVEEFLKGNPYWKDRFNDDGIINKKWKFNHGARYFMGYDDLCHKDSIDNDEKTVWTNLSPFESKSGSSDLRKELMAEGISSTLELIKILQPKHIVLLGKNAFQVIENNLESDSDIIEFSSVFSNVKAQVGRIYNIPTVSFTHPSGQWDISNKFNSMFVFIHGLAEMTNKRDTIKPLKDVVEIMRNEMKMWKERVCL